MVCAVPCRAEAPLLRTAARDWHSRHVVVLGIASNDTVPDARAFQREFRLTYPQGTDPNGPLAARYGLTGLPATFIIDPHGVVRAVMLGQLSKSTLDDALGAVMRGNSVARNPGGPLRPPG